MASLGASELTQWGQVTHIYVSKLTSIGSDNGLLPDRLQAIIWTKCWNNVNWILGEHILEWNRNQNSYIFIQENTFENVFCKMATILSETQCVNSLWPSDTIWRHGIGSTLVQVMACCLTAPSHYLNQCWLIISKVQWHSSDGNFTRDTSSFNH